MNCEMRPAHDITGAIRGASMSEHLGRIFQAPESPLSPEVSINRSICACIAAAGLGWSLEEWLCRLYVDERNTMRRVCFAIRSNAGAIPPGGAVHTRKTVSMPSRHASRVSGR